jgi:hypothetical protein
MHAKSFKSTAAAKRSLERREAEDDAPRLTSSVPSLRSARIQITELTPTGSTNYIKHVIVARAPALFLVPCGDSSCQDGGHDITPSIMSAFRRQLLSFEGEDSCPGTCGTASCGRSIRYQLTAEYTAQPPDGSR